MTIEISVVCPVTRHAADLCDVHEEFSAVLARTGRSAEFLYVFDGARPAAEKSLAKVREKRFPVRILRRAKGFGEATALQAGFARAVGKYVLSIADRPQIDPNTVGEILKRLDAGEDVVVTRREPRSDALANRVQSKVFHALVHGLTGQSYHDLSCGLRGFTLEAARKMDLYGDQHRFIPIIAARRSFQVSEIPGRQHPRNMGLRVRKPGVYARRLLDVLNIYFLTRFTRKPLRFFGLIGLILGAGGFLISAILAVQRVLGLSSLANRPALLLGVLMIVLGVQVMSIGLLGEIIIFLSEKRDSPEVTRFDEETRTPDEAPLGRTVGE